jgi:tRNA-specific 2-thiouridylase
MKIAVLLSGGVDSSVALSLLKDEGHELEAFYLKIWLEDELAFLGNCPWDEDIEYAKQVCDKLGVKFSTINMQSDYLETVVDYTISELKAGRTPSPDVLCNKYIKFGKFLEKIDTSWQKVASGHYAQVAFSNDKYFLKKAPDAVKDQTYFLNYLNQEQLSKIVFPIGQYSKKEVRQLAEKYDLANKNRADSQGICFLGKIKFSDFVKYHLGEKEGSIINIDNGKILGKHRGYWYHTIGQRQGLGLGGGPWYVVKKDLDENIIYVSNLNDVENKWRSDLTLCKVNWISKLDNLEDIDNLTIKLRHGPREVACGIKLLEDNRVYVKMQNQDQGVASGQFGIIYYGDYCLGGGVIE